MLMDNLRLDSDVEIQAARTVAVANDLHRITSMQKHGRVHIGDYSPTELIMDIDNDKDPAQNDLHGTTSMQDQSVAW